MEQLRELLRHPQCRLLTLVGPGGIGKTRLAIDAAASTQDAMVGARRQIELTHRRPHQTMTLVLHPAKLPDLRDAQIRVAGDVRIAARETLALNIARFALTSESIRWSPHIISSELFVIHAWDLNIDIFAVEKAS